MKFFFIILILSISNNIFSDSLLGTKHVQTIVLGSGCFWGVEKNFESIPGVIDVTSGYADGKGVRPIYRDIISLKNRFNPDNHAEVVKIIFNSNLVSFEKLLEIYFESHDPTQRNKQGNDIGTQYRSLILTTNQLQKNIALNKVKEFQLLLNEAGYGLIVTDIKPLLDFYKAEKYHQDYLKKNPNGYCPNHSTGIKFQEKEDNLIDNQKLKDGLQIVVIESQAYCPYCKKFKENVTSSYAGSIPISFRMASQLEGLEVVTETWVTPTILFLENGKEIYGKQGYMSPEDFYKTLGQIKFGNTEAYRVAFEEGTDARFCKEYKIFKNTPDGLFLDKLSGAPLFDTRDRFNSSSGWLSFTKAIDNSILERLDNRYGMKRIEIRSKTSGIHLGHVFPDGPGGMPRYCINATVLDFRPRGS